MVRVCYPVVDIVKVLEVIVEFLGRAGLEEAAGYSIGFTSLVVSLPGSGRFHVVHVSEVLTVRSEGCIVFMIGKLFVPHHPYTIKAFVCPPPPGEMILGLRFGLRTEKDPALKIILHFSPG